MPRLHPRILHQARKTDSLLPLLLLATRTLSSAKNELRWLKEFVSSPAQPRQHSKHDNHDITHRKLKKLCLDRSRGKPLQYILSSEYFGDLEIECAKGVLIPRQETAASVTNLISLIHQNGPKLPEKIKILDLCTGSGCIPLLSYYEFSKHDREVKDLEVVGVDISTTAIALANKNLQRMISDGTLSPNPDLRFLQADILTTKDGEGGNGVMALDTALQHYTSTPASTSTSIATSAATGKNNWDILISNPPYISPSAFAHTTTRSVKRYEPRLALVPPSPSSPSSSSPLLDAEHGDLFYPRLLSLASSLSSKIILFEVADLEQAKRVASMAEKQGIWEGIEIWRDDPCGDGHQEGDMETETETESGIKVLGAGNGRTVVAYRGEGKDWMCTA